VATTSRWLELPPPQLLLPRLVGAEVPEVTSALVKRMIVMMEVCVAQCTTLGATMLRHAEKSRNSWSSTVNT
jgi:hypothetical protein